LCNSLSEYAFIHRWNVYAGSRNHFRLIDRYIGYGKARNNSPIAGNIARGPSVIVVGS
jgi:hypothetical protein